MASKLEHLGYTIVHAHFKSSDTFQARVWKADVPLKKFVAPSEQQALDAARDYVKSGAADRDLLPARQEAQEKKNASQALTIERHEKYMAEHGFEDQGVADSSLGPSFVMFPVCWSCGTNLDLHGLTCKRCRRYICRACGACRCGFQPGDSSFVLPQSEWLREDSGN